MKALDDFLPARADRTLVSQNLLTLFDDSRVLSDTQIRTILDIVKPEKVRLTISVLHSAAQRGGSMEQLDWLDGKCFPSSDGAETFASTQVHLQALRREESQERTQR